MLISLHEEQDRAVKFQKLFFFYCGVRFPLSVSDFGKFAVQGV